MEKVEPKSIAKYASNYYRFGAVDYKSKGEKVRIQKILSFCEEQKIILDIGCFNKTIGELLIKRGNKVYGMDVSKEAVNLACRKGIYAVIADLEKQIPFKNNSFDIVVGAEIIEHIFDPDFLFKEIKRVLRPNGYLVLTTPNVASLGRRLWLLFGKNPFFEASLGFPPNANAGHIRFFTKDLLLNYLHYQKFKIVKFSLDVVNFNSSGSICSGLVAKMFPTLGSRLIVKAQII